MKKKGIPFLRIVLNRKYFLKYIAVNIQRTKLRMVYSLINSEEF